jgi:hypothetical protein
MEYPHFLWFLIVIKIRLPEGTSYDCWTLNSQFVYMKMSPFCWILPAKQRQIFEPFGTTRAAVLEGNHRRCLMVNSGCWAATLDCRNIQHPKCWLILIDSNQSWLDLGWFGIQATRCGSSWTHNADVWLLNMGIHQSEVMGYGSCFQPKGYLDFKNAKQRNRNNELIWIFSHETR